MGAAFSTFMIFRICKSAINKKRCVLPKSLPGFIFTSKRCVLNIAKIKYFDKGFYCIILPLFLNEFCKRHHWTGTGDF